MRMNPKSSDIKLLNYLYHNGTEPATKVAKSTKLSREQVEYKIKKYFSEGIVKQFFTLFNYPLLGYTSSVSLLLKIKSSKTKEFSEKLKEDKNCLSKGEIIGDFDFFMDMVFKDEKEMNNYISNLFQENKDCLVDCLVLKSFFIEYYPLRFLSKQTGKKNVYSVDQQEIFKERYSIDEKDKIILKMMSQDARVKIVDIAEKIKLTPEAVLYRLRKLERDRIILGSRMFFDANKLGYYLADVLLEIKPFSSSIQEKIKKFARGNNKINHVFFLFNQPNCLMQIIFRSQKELQDAIKEIKNIFQDEFIKIKILFPKPEDKINTLPFY